MSVKKMITMYLYTRYERFWHWLQMALIFVLLVTGFKVHGTFPFLGFNEAVDVHNYVGLSWLIAFAFFAFGTKLSIYIKMVSSCYLPSIFQRI